MKKREVTKLGAGPRQKKGGKMRGKRGGEKTSKGARWE